MNQSYLDSVREGENHWGIYFSAAFLEAINANADLSDRGIVAAIALFFNFESGSVIGSITQAKAEQKIVLATLRQFFC